MFGESDSESPRVPSPWDSLASTSSPLGHNGIHTIPKLVPEVEEGNVEYKLQLLSPSPARFARLVTQLNWRLLEGGGKAYYELGVADSGTLVGLPRQQLGESLETLEMMAGEIGASVIVVKEIEVPPELSSLAESELERWDGRRSARRKDLLRLMKQDVSPTISPTECETELSSTDITDAEESSCYSPTTPPASPDDPSRIRLVPTPFPFDPALAMFTMDAREDVAYYTDNEAPDSDVPTDLVTDLFVGLEIRSVYKPLPMKKRATYITSLPSTHLEYVKKRLPNGSPPSKTTDTICHTRYSIAQDSLETLSPSKGAEVKFRRDKHKRDKRRELRHNAPLTRVPARRSIESPTNSVHHHIVPSCSADKSNSSALEFHHVTIVDPPASDASGTTTITSKESRLIVEVLVIRELSSDGAFLDFEGFSLQ